MTIGGLRIGAPLIMGEYGVDNVTKRPIIWLKGTSNCDFITKDAVDYLPFDAMERDSADEHTRFMGNPRYSVSNLLQFLNSSEESWFKPMHQHDAPPNRRNLDWGSGSYDGHYGFLYFFEEYEVASLKQDSRIVDADEVLSTIRLPAVADFIGPNKLKLFAKKGIRPRPTEDLVFGKPSLGFQESSYIPFWVSDRSGLTGHAAFIARNGSIDGQYPKIYCGVRPVCTISPETMVVLNGDGFYRIVPFTVVGKPHRTDEELRAFLGLA